MYKLCPPSSSDDLCHFFCLHPSSMPNCIANKRGSVILFILAKFILICCTHYFYINFFILAILFILAIMTSVAYRLSLFSFFIRIIFILILCVIFFIQVLQYRYTYFLYPIYCIRHYLYTLFFPVRYCVSRKEAGKNPPNPATTRAVVYCSSG